ncbi:MAG TPA: sigma-70 family RNA polymerase sigma factor [Thermoanaerobaculia bacterium]|jgi:RNA polymerase sigma-70 factor (ECF subfamily)
MTAANSTFEELLAQHGAILTKVTSAYCRDRHDREDLAQEIVLQLWRSFGRYDSRLRFSTWMYRVAMNVAISHYRARKAAGGEAMPLDETTGIAVAHDAAERDDTRVLYDLIRELDELNRAVIVLYLDGHSHLEISAIVGLSATNVATKVNRIKEQLKTRYEEKNK